MSSQRPAPGERFSPVRSVWLHPAKTVGRVAHENPGYRLFALPILAGLATYPTLMFFYLDVERLYIGLFWLTLLSLGPLLELLQVFLGAYVVQLIGTRFGGRAGIHSIQAAIVWGNVPVVFVALIGIPIAIVSLILTEGAAADLTNYPLPIIVAFGYFLSALQLVLVAWSVIILVNGLAAVQGYSRTSALLNLLLAWSVPAGLITAGAIVFGYGDKIFELFFAGTSMLFFIHAQ